jgi:Family of unknown function (DUF5770)
MSDYEDDEDNNTDYDYNDSDKEYASEDDERDTDTIYKPERKANERVGLPGFIVGPNPQSRLERAMMDPLDRFRLYVDAISRALGNWDKRITQKDIDKMLVMAGDLDVVEYKNPTGYILGYLATGGGIKMDKDQFNYVIKNVLPHAEHQESVLPPDVIRYSRLWIKLNKASK